MWQDAKTYSLTSLRIQDFSKPLEPGKSVKAVHNGTAGTSNAQGTRSVCPKVVVPLNQFQTTPKSSQLEGNFFDPHKGWSDTIRFVLALTV